MATPDYRNIQNTDTDIAKMMRLRFVDVEVLSTDQLLEEKAYYEQHEAFGQVDDSRYQAILAELRERT